jgi:two-component system NtrC family sensor kinase
MDNRREQDKVQAQLLQSAKLASMGELVAGVAHELGSPLTTILGFAELLLKGNGVDSSHQEGLEVIVEEARRARSIVHNLLDFVRQARAEREPVDVNLLLKQTLTVIGYQIDRSEIVIEENCSPNIGALFLNEGQMKQVFLNLINNALQAMPEGGVLRLGTARIGDEVSVWIADTGTGIPLEQQGQIFDPFFSTKPEGTGLGLPVSLEIVRAHGGRITVDSKTGVGSTFTVWLPVEAVGEEEESGGRAGPCDDLENGSRTLEHLVRIEELANGVHPARGEIRPEAG